MRSARPALSSPRSTTGLLTLLIAGCSTPQAARWEVTAGPDPGGGGASLTIDPAPSSVVKSEIEEGWGQLRGSVGSTTGNGRDEVLLLWRDPGDPEGVICIGRITGQLRSGPDELPFEPRIQRAEGDFRASVVRQRAELVVLQGGGGRDALLVAGPDCSFERLFEGWPNPPTSLVEARFEAPAVVGVRLQGGSGDDLLVAPSDGRTSWRLEGGSGDDRLVAVATSGAASIDGGSGADGILFAGRLGGGGVLLDREGYDAELIAGPSQR